MPAKSKAQLRYMEANKSKIGEAKVKEIAEASKGLKLPERAAPKAHKKVQAVKVSKDLDEVRAYRKKKYGF